MKMKVLPWIKSWFKRPSLKMIQEIHDDDVYGFIKQSQFFKNAGNERQWYLLDNNGNEIGFFWFKNILGGWRLQLNSDTGDEWDDRGVINTVTRLKTILETNMKILLPNPLTP